jgi:hypothetical protein
MALYVGAMQKFVASFGPYFLRNKQIGSFLESVAMAYDVSLQQLDFGLRLGQPLRCEASALPVISNDRGIRFYPGESELSQRKRLSQWLQIHRADGTNIGQLKNTQPYFQPFSPVMRMVHQSGDAQYATWHTLEADGSYSIYQKSPSNWNWDGQHSHWSRCWAILYPPNAYLSLNTYSDGMGYSYGPRHTGANTEQIGKDLVGMLSETKAAHSALWGAILTTDADFLNPTGTSVAHPDGWTTMPEGNWGQPFNGAMKRNRDPRCLMIYDRRLP